MSSLACSLKTRMSGLRAVRSPLMLGVSEPDVDISGRGATLAPLDELCGPVVQMPQRDAAARRRRQRGGRLLMRLMHRRERRRGEGVLVLKESPPLL